MKRSLVGKQDGKMAVVDAHSDLFMRPFFIAGLIVTEMRPATICKTVGTFKTRREAEDAAREALALSSHQSSTEAS